MTDVFLKINNDNLLASNFPLIENQPKTYLSGDEAAAQTSLSVQNDDGFADDDYVLIGNFGEPTCEIGQLAAAPSSNTFTVGATTFDHYAGTPITKLDYNQVEFSYASTLAGDKTVLGSLQTINAERLESTNATMLNTITGYATMYWFCRFKNATTSKFSDYSTGVYYTELTANTAGKIMERARQLASVTTGEDSEFATDQQCLNDINNAQRAISEETDWMFELVLDDTSLSATENENKYALSGLTYALKYPNSTKGIQNVRFGNAILDKITIEDMDKNFEGTVKTTVDTAISEDDTSIVLTDTYEFAEAGNVYIGEDTIAYTANTETTGTLSGCTDVDNDHSAGATVWQNISPGTPSEYTIFDEYIYLDVPIKTAKVGYKIKMRYLKALTAVTSLASTTEVPFYRILDFYVAAQIQYRKGNMTEGNNLKGQFSKQLVVNKKRYKISPMDDYEYYSFDSGDSALA